MEKNSVQQDRPDTDAEGGLKKHAENRRKCPVPGCPHDGVEVGNVLKCPDHGTEPWEGRP